MSKLQPPTPPQPGGYDTQKQVPDDRKIPGRVISSHTALFRMLAGLVVTLSPSLAFADSITFELTERSYQSSEQHTYPPAELAHSLSAAPLPDPASIVTHTEFSPRSRFGPVFQTNDDAWITGIGTLLYNDADQDGYHSGLSLTIDADTAKSFTEVYVTIDLQSYAGLPERLHTSNRFSLYGSTLTDEYQIDIDLLQNYLADDYDLTIELHDGYDDRVLDRVYAEDFSNLSAVPLESEDQDYFQDLRPVQLPFPPANDDIRVAEYAGSAGLLTTLCLALLVSSRGKKRI